jgi:hypothetical protein
VSFLLAGLIIAGTSGAVAVGRWLSRRQGSVDAKPDGAGGTTGATDEARDTSGGAPATAAGTTTSSGDAATKDAAKKGAKKPVKRTVEGPITHLEGFPCQLGDVLLRLTGEEAWLAGGLVLCEEGPVAALFVAPDAVHDCAIYVRPQPREAVFWMQPLDPGAVLVGGEPPSSVEHGGIRFDRARRLPLRPRRIGVGAPDVGDAVVLAEYASAGSERLLVMRSTTGTSYAYRGEELDPASYEVIPSGRSTLDND